MTNRKAPNQFVIHDGGDKESDKPICSGNKSPFTGFHPAGNDPILQIAQEVVLNKMSSEDAVTRIIENVLSSDMISAAPEELRREVADMLLSAVDTDSFLQELVARVKK